MALQLGCVGILGHYVGLEHLAALCVDADDNARLARFKAVCLTQMPSMGGGEVGRGDEVLKCGRDGL